MLTPEDKDEAGTDEDTDGEKEEEEEEEEDTSLTEKPAGDQSPVSWSAVLSAFIYYCSSC